jgi:hypothetical protein
MEGSIFELLVALRSWDHAVRWAADGAFAEGHSFTENVDDLLAEPPVQLTGDEAALADSDVDRWTRPPKNGDYAGETRECSPAWPA